MAHAAFLKGINLGRRRVSNDELRSHFETIGLGSPAIFRASGNVVFEDPDARPEPELAKLIETELERLLGYPVVVFLRNRRELLAIARSEPFDAATLSRLAGKLQVALLLQAPGATARDAVLALAGQQDALAFGKRELFWLPAGPMSDSKLEWKAVERALGPTTTRTMGTIRQIAARHFDA